MKIRVLDSAIWIKREATDPYWLRCNAEFEIRLHPDRLPDGVMDRATLDHIAKNLSVDADFFARVWAESVGGNQLTSPPGHNEDG